MQSQENIAILIALGCLVMFTLVGVIILFVAIYQRKILLKEAKIQLLEQEKQIGLFKASVKAEEQQKEKIARNLHDEINPILAVLKFNLSRHRIELQKNKFEPDSLIADTQLLDQAIEGIRSTCLELIPTFLLQYGLVKSLEDYLMQLSNSQTIHVEFENKTHSPDLELFDKQTLLNTYRMCLELLNNILKHTQADFLKISLSCYNQALHIQLTHNGKGVSNGDMEQFTQNSKGLGLKSLQARALIVNAAINYTKQTNSSFITLSIPYPHE